jgi:hypothetical protein
VKVSSSICPSTGSNIFPITADNLKKFQIVPRQFELEKLPENLIGIPIALILLTFASTIV